MYPKSEILTNRPNLAVIDKKYKNTQEITMEYITGKVCLKNKKMRQIEFNKSKMSSQIP